MPDSSTPEVIAEFSRNRLNGEQVPADVEALLLHRAEVAERLGVNLAANADWAPWLDTSYLSPEDLANSGIMANVKAIHDVCGLISFIAYDEESQYYGYWRGAEANPISRAPLVLLDNEGQFRQCAGTTFAEAIYVDFAESYSQKPGEMRDWLRSVGVNLRPECPDLVPWRDIPYPPSRLHRELYEKYLEQ
jgi:hypothetical protein